MLAFAASVGITAGVAEVHWISLGVGIGVQIRLSPHYVWMAPVAIGVFALSCGLLLLGLGRRWPRARSPSVVAGVLAGLAALELLLLIGPLYRPAALVLAAGVGVQASRMARWRVARPVYRLAPVVGLVLALYVAALGVRMASGLRADARTAQAALPPPRTGAPNVLLLILDTVRAKGLLADGAYAAPQLARFAEHAASFERAIAPSPWTLPSHASMFTGQWPIALSVDSTLYFDTAHPTLAEALNRRGYLTAGFVANLLWLTRRTGLGRGFITWDDYQVSPGQVLLSTSLGRLLAGDDTLRRLIGYHELLNRRSATDITNAFLDWQERNPGRTFFAFLNFFDAHEPWFPSGYSGSVLWPGQRWTDFGHGAMLQWGEAAWVRNKWAMPPERSAIHAAGYYEAVQSIDAQLGRLLDELDRRGVLDNTVVVITSDHGEQLGEHGLYEHNNSLYLPALHVPLLIRPAGGLDRPVTVPQVVSLRDLPATVLDLLGESPNEFPGRSLVPLWDLPSSAHPAGVGVDTAFSHLVGGYAGEDDRPTWYPVRRGYEMFSLTTRRHHYIVNGDESEELYDWENDPAESVDLSGRPASDSLLVRFREALAALRQGW